MQTPPPPPSPPTNVPQQVQDHDQAAWVLEAAAVAATAGVIAAEIAAAVLMARRVWRHTYGNHTDRQRDAEFRRITADLSTRLQRIDVTPASVILDYAHQAHALGVEQGFEELDLPATPIPSRFDLSTHLAVSRAQLNAQEQMRRSIALVDSLQAGSWRTVENAASTAQQAANTIERTTATVFNTELNNGITAAAEAVGAQRVWVAERNACLHCLALSGHVVDVGQAFPMDLTFGAKPLTWEPISAGGLTGPPRHPSCRCRCMPWRGHNGPPDTIDFPTALKREAERSVLNGVALPTESPKQRVDAAGRLLALIGDGKNSRSPSGWPVPATVKQRARRATTRGTFTPLAPRRGTSKE